MKRFFAVITSTILVFILAGCSLENSSSDSSFSNNSGISNPGLVTSATMKRYRENELMEYEGTRLDPAIGPRDNSISGIQEVEIASYSLKVDGLVETEKIYTYDQILEMDSTQKVYTIYCVEGWDATFLWKGVLMKEILLPSEVKSQAKTVIFHAVDGYTTSLPLAEIFDNNLMLAYDVNGLPLPPSLGFPFIFVAQDKWGYKWARWVNRIELSADTNYKGFWESRGYDNNADLD